MADRYLELYGKLTEQQKLDYLEFMWNEPSVKDQLEWLESHV